MVPYGTIQDNELMLDGYTHRPNKQEIIEGLFECLEYERDTNTRKWIAFAAEFLREECRDEDLNE